MLLTLADGQGTRPEAWSDWKESLVWQSFHETSRYLADRKSYYEQTRIERESLQAAVAENRSPDYTEDIEAHFEFMPDNYFRASDLSEVAERLKFFRGYHQNVSPGDFPRAPGTAW